MENRTTERIFALLIDSFIYTVTTSIIYLAFSLPEKIFSHKFHIYGFEVSTFFEMTFICTIVYFFLFDLFNDGKTFGKMILKIKVVSADGEKLKTSDKIKRTVLKMVSLSTLPLAILVYLINGFILQDKFTASKTVKYNQ